MKNNSRKVEEYRLDIDKISAEIVFIQKNSNFYAGEAKMEKRKKSNLDLTSFELEYQAALSKKRTAQVLLEQMKSKLVSVISERDSFQFSKQNITFLASEKLATTKKILY